MEDINKLSLVIPAYKQEKTIVADIHQLETVLQELQYTYEIIVVIDGYIDNTLRELKKIKSKEIKTIGYEKNHGKGYAIQQGVKEAQGNVIGFIDAGMDIDPSEIKLMLGIMDFNNADIVIGSKLHPESKVNYPIYRQVMSIGYRFLLRILFNLHIRDTQVGLKLFRRKVAKDIFSRTLVDKFAFDIEVLAVAQTIGYTKIYEAPIRLTFNEKSTIGTVTSSGFWKVILWMLWDTLAVFYRLKIKKQYKRE